jgi:hypothetical protein
MAILQQAKGEQFPFVWIPELMKGGHLRSGNPSDTREMVDQGLQKGTELVLWCAFRTFAGQLGLQCPSESGDGVGETLLFFQCVPARHRVDPVQP